MKVGLIDVDGHNFPNLVLMKLSAYHKLHGDYVEWCLPLEEYDRVYMSKVFTYTPDFETCIRAFEVIRGGTGYNLHSKLPDEIDHIYPDYNLYGIKDTAYGFLTRGCPWNCEFCIVGRKEGYISHKVADLDQFWRGQKFIKLLDPNILACKDHEELLKQLIKSGAWIDFTQGLDARFLTLDNVKLISKLKIKMLHFAWDNPNDETVPYMLWHFKKATCIDRRKAAVYVLTNFNSTFEQDLYRVYKLKELGYDPYVMIYNKHKLKKGHRLKRLQRWVNCKYIFMSCNKFEDYDTKIG